MARKGNCGCVESPFTGKIGGDKMPGLTSAKGVYDRNPAPMLGKPRDMGKHSLPEKFIDGNLGPMPGSVRGRRGRGV